MKPHLLLALLLIPLTAHAGGKKMPTGSISFHIEGAAAEAPKISREVTTEAGKGFFRVVPEISNNDATAFSPFPAEGGNGYGIVIKLNKKATRKLEVISTLYQGKLLLSIINGEPHDVVRIDKPIKDGTLVIWQGVTLAQINSYDLIVPRIGENEDTWKERVKEIKKSYKEKAKRDAKKNKD